MFSIRFLPASDILRELNVNVNFLLVSVYSRNSPIPPVSHNPPYPIGLGHYQTKIYSQIDLSKPITSRNP